MVDVDIANDLEQVNQQLAQLVEQLNKMNTEREQVTQQIHNLNGIAMYLRGKQNETEESIPERSHEYPPDEGEEV
jgi:cell division protein FtsB